MNWNSIIIQILLNGNFIAGDAAAVAAAYNTALLDDSVLTDSGAEFPFAGIVDRILQAMTLIITAIGENRESEYRSYFLSDTAPIASGALIPTAAASSASKARFGVISDARDSATNTYLTETPRELVLIARRNHARQIIKPFQFFTDDVHLWHTRNNAVCEIVAWDKAAERVAMIMSNNTAVCPLPVELLPALEFGSLAGIHRDNFNKTQAGEQLQKFVPELNRIAGKAMAAGELAAKL